MKKQLVILLAVAVAVTAYCANVLDSATSVNTLQADGQFSQIANITSEKGRGCTMFPDCKDW